MIVGDDAAEVGAAVARHRGRRILAFVGAGGDEALGEMLAELAPKPPMGASAGSRGPETEES